MKQGATRSTAQSVCSKTVPVDSVQVAASLRPFFSYYGGKWNMAKKYPRPEHRIIVEPFAGSAGYSLRYPSHSVVLVERFATVAALWRWLIRIHPKEILALPDIEAGEMIPGLDVCDEAKALIGFWANAACEKPRLQMSKWAKAATHQLYWGPRVRSRIVEQVAQIRHWTVIEGDYTEAPDVRATWFVDPPYNNSAGSRYVHAGLDYRRLGDWCRVRKGQTIVCENEGATWLPFVPLAVAKGQVKRGKQKWSAEAVWVGGTEKGSK